MRYLIIALLAIMLGANDKIYEIVSQYRKNGINSIKSTLDMYLMDKQYWDNVVANKDTRFGYYESVKYIFVAQKNNANLQLFKIDSNKLTQLNNTNAIFGKNKEDKKLQGDLATPIGVYDLTNKLQNLDQYYGPLAFVTSYPNLYDKLNKKTGYGIWIHGFPLNGDRTEANTKGCIVVENDDLLGFDKYINYQDSILISSKVALEEVSKNTLANILQSLFIWRNAWINNDLDLYLSFYDDGFRRFDGMNINNFKAYKKRIFDKKETKTIEFDKINITPYPNTQNADMYRITFIENYKANSGYTFSGVKELYVLVKNDKMNIIVEKYYYLRFYMRICR